MKPISEESFINYCLDKTFKHNIIRNNQKTFQEADHDVIFSVKNNSLVLEKRGNAVEQDTFDLRVTSTLDCFRWALEHLDVNINCKFILNPNDNTHFQKSRNISTLGYSTPQSSNHLAIPDPHLLAYSGATSAFDPLALLVGMIQDRILDPPPFFKKRNQAIFRGADTNSQRVRVSYRAASHALIDSKITVFYQRPHDELIFSSFTSTQKQLEYNCVLDMYGNANSWDRCCWVLPSNSVLVAVTPREELQDVHTWYSHFIYHNGIVPQLTEDELFEVKDFSQFSNLNSTQQNFSRLLLGHDTILSFMCKFLTRYNEEFNS